MRDKQDIFVLKQKTSVRRLLPGGPVVLVHRPCCSCLPQVTKLQGITSEKIVEFTKN